MLAYVQAFINIALRRSGPEDLPDSRFLLGVALVFYLLTQVPLALITYGPTGVLVNTVIVSLLLMFGGLWALLSLTGHRARFQRTVTAMLGIGALLSVLSIPFSLWRQSLLDTDTGVGMPSLFLLAIMFWSIAIEGHILARALSRPYVIGLLVAIIYFFLQTTILVELMPSEFGNQPG